MDNRPEPTVSAEAAAAAGLAALGLSVPRICLPDAGIDLYRWPVVACDQFTSEPEYWRESADIVGDAPSTLHMILPELYLEHPGEETIESRIDKINQTMKQYLSDGTLRALPPGWILTDRSTKSHPSRKGLVAAIDLDCYDFKPGNHNLIRATEGTVLERIPPRLMIRRDAPLELPHVQILIDDPARSVIEPLFDRCRSGRSVYETPLMQDGGSVRSWFIEAGSPGFHEAVHAMAQLDSVRRLGLLGAVGDGNHSLATAKAHWENVRKSAGPDHPARFALVELINIHDDGLEFEPIHRAIFGLSPDKFSEAAAGFFQDQAFSFSETGPTASGRPGPDNGASPAAAGGASPAAAGLPAGQAIPMLCRNRCWTLRIGRPAHSLTAGTLQPFLDSLVKNAACRVDYIHGADVVRRLAEGGAVGLLLPVLDKSAFFGIIAREGVLPRKTFSMGEAREKRYYFECRRIT